jgi:hypothetical protein
MGEEDSEADPVLSLPGITKVDPSYSCNDPSRKYREF